MINKNELSEFLLSSVSINKLFDEIIDKMLDYVNLCIEKDFTFERGIFHDRAITLHFLQSEFKILLRLVTTVIAVEEGKSKEFILNSLNEIIGKDFKYNLVEEIELCELHYRENFKDGYEDFSKIFKYQKEFLEFIYTECEELGIFE